MGVREISDNGDDGYRATEPDQAGTGSQRQLPVFLGQVFVALGELKKDHEASKRNNKAADIRGGHFSASLKISESFTFSALLNAIRVESEGLRTPRSISERKVAGTSIR
jgi:hypothetical protein